MTRALVEVYEIEGTSPIGYVHDIISGEVTTTISEIRQWQFVIKCSNPNRSLLTIGREIKIFRQGIVEPDIHGKIENLDFSFQGSEPYLVVSGSGIEIELVYANTLRGLVFDDEAMTFVFDKLLENTSWTGAYAGLSDTFNQISRRIDNTTIWQALKDIADIQAGFIRTTHTPRVVEVLSGIYAVALFASPSKSGLKLTNYQYPPDEVPDNVGVITQILSARQDSSELYNRIFPFGKIDGHETFDLRESTKSTSGGDAYDIEVTQAGPPVAANVETRDEDTDSTNVGFRGSTGAQLNQVEVIGIDRVLLSGHFTWGISGNGFSEPAGDWYDGVLSSSLRLDFGQFGTAGVNRLIKALLWQFSRAGVMNHEWNYASGNAAPHLAFDVPIQNASRYNTMRDETGAAGTGTSTSITIDSSDTDLVVSLLMLTSNATVTLGADQDALYNGIVDGTHRAVISVKRGTAPTASMSYSWTGSTGYTHFCFGIRAAPNYYIEDTDSIATYGLRVKPVSLGEYKIINLSHIAEAADTLYDKAVTYLRNHKDPIWFYDFEVKSFPELPFLIGDTILTQYNGVAETENGSVNYLEIDEDLIVVSKTLRFSESGEDIWDISVATKNVLQRNMNDLLGQAYVRLDDIQNSQV